jgi:uncharacterized protein YbcI
MGVHQDSYAGGELHAAISNTVVRITAEYTGRGPTQARTIINGDWVFVTLVDTLTKGERRLGENGREHSVRSTRREYQDVMREEFTAEVERLTGRKVIAFMSDNHIDPDVAIEAFMLEPRPA